MGQRKMTILPDDRYFSRWQRAKARSQVLMDDFKNWCADGNARLPDGWNPNRLERGFTEVLSEMEKVMQDRRPKS
jgi:hypothetical protein